MDTLSDLWVAYQNGEQWEDCYIVRMSINFETNVIKRAMFKIAEVTPLDRDWYSLVLITPDKGIMTHTAHGINRIWHRIRRDDAG